MRVALAARHKRGRALSGEEEADPAKIAACLPGEGGLAFVVDRGRVFFARAEPGGLSAVAALILGVWQLAPRRALLLLRRRVWVTGAPSEADLEMIRVAAKRWGQVAVGERPGQRAALRVDVAPAARQGRALAAVWLAPPVAATGAPMALATRIAAGARREGRLAERDRSVGAVMVGEDGRVLAAARNRNGRCRVRHAELSLLLVWSARHGAVPAGAALWVTLQPCRMCAAAWVAACKEPDHHRVWFAEADPGPMARHTALERRGTQQRFCESSPS